MLELTKNNFEEKTNSGFVLVDFWAPWCGPCQMLGPIFEELSKEFENKVLFAKVNVDGEQELAQKYNVSGIPCLLLLKDGKEVDRIVGALPKERLLERIESIITAS